MTDKTNRPRGRPKGASRLNDEDMAILRKVAKIVTDADPPVPPTTAMGRLGIFDETPRRRLQRKWKVEGPALMEAERARRSEDNSAARSSGGYASYPYNPYREHLPLSALVEQTRSTSRATEATLRLASDPYGIGSVVRATESRLGLACFDYPALMAGLAGHATKAALGLSAINASQRFHEQMERDRRMNEILEQDRRWHEETRRLLAQERLHRLYL